MCVCCLLYFMLLENQLIFIVCYAVLIYIGMIIFFIQLIPYNCKSFFLCRSHSFETSKHSILLTIIFVLWVVWNVHIKFLVTSEWFGFKIHFFVQTKS